MNISVICVGKLKESYWTEAVAEYSKRLGRYCRLDVEELKEARLPDKASAADEAAVKQVEGRSILGRLKKGDYVIALEVSGKTLSSEALAEKLGALSMESHSRIVFVIGGSLGLSAEVRSRSDLQLSFSQMTFPHQMMRAILLEQIYRSFKILKKETYHK